MRSVDNISQELFDKIRSRVSTIKLGDENGAVTTDPSQARFFEFQFKHRDLPIGAVTISLNEEGVLNVYFPNSMVEDVDSYTADAWYGFLKELSKFSARNMLNYETHNVTKERLDKKDYQFLTQRNQDEVMENRLHGTSQKSFLETGTAKLIIKHNKAVDETKMGARSRNISAIYIENSEGERFKFANNYLPGARAMARHVSNEGHTRDDRGAHIVEIMKEMTDLKTFVRGVKREEYVNEDAQEVIDAATDRYYGLKDTLKAISSAKGYNDYFENWVPGVVEVDENDIEDLKQKLTRTVYDDRLTDSLPSVGRAMEQRKQVREANMSDLIAFANSDENIEVYNNEADIGELKNYMQFMKNSDMDVSRKNRSILVAIMKYLSNNMTNDAAANALSEIELDDPAQQKMAYQIAKKYLQGKVDIKQPKAKKDLYGKDKTEGVTFESYEQRMNMITEGTWALPENEAEAMKLAAMMDQPIALGDGGDDAANALGGLIGDDELFDDLGAAGDKDPEGDARPIIIGWLMDHVDDYDQKFQETMKMALEKIRADGNDTMVIPRTFGARQDRGMSKQQANMSATQGERMGSNADDVKANEAEIDEDPNEGNEFSGALAQAKKDGKDEFEVDGKKYKVKEEAMAAGICTLKCKDCDDMLGRPTTNCPHDSMDPKGDNWEMVDIDGDGDADIAVASEGRMSDLAQEIDEVIADMEADMELYPFTNEFRNEVMKSYNIKAALEKVLPDYVSGSKIEKLVGEAMDEDVVEGFRKGDNVVVNDEQGYNDFSAPGKILGLSSKGNRARIRFANNKTEIIPISMLTPESVEEVEVDEAADMIAKMKAMAGVGSKAKSNHGIHEGEEGYQLTPRSIVAREMRKLQDIERGSK